MILFCNTVESCHMCMMYDLSTSRYRAKEEMQYEWMRSLMRSECDVQHCSCAMTLMMLATSWLTFESAVMKKAIPSLLTTSFHLFLFYVSTHRIVIFPACVTDRIPLNGLYDTPRIANPSTFNPDDANILTTNSARTVGASSATYSGGRVIVPSKVGTLSLGMRPISQRHTCVSGSILIEPKLGVNWAERRLFGNGIITAAFVTCLSELCLLPTMIWIRDEPGW